MHILYCIYPQINLARAGHSRIDHDVFILMRTSYCTILVVCASNIDMHIIGIIFIFTLICIPYYLSLQVNLVRAGHSMIDHVIFILLCLPHHYMSLWVNLVRAGHIRIDHVMLILIFTPYHYMYSHALDLYYWIYIYIYIYMCTSLYASTSKSGACLSQCDWSCYIYINMCTILYL
jgi:hypothetical protein